MCERTEAGSIQEALSAVSLSSEHLQLAERFVAEHGLETFELLMRGGGMLADLRDGSKWALRSAMGAYEAHVPVVLMTRIHRDAKRSGERVDMRLVSGDAQLVVDFPSG